MTHLSTHSGLGIHSLLLVYPCTGCASLHDDKTTLGFQKVVALTNKRKKQIWSKSEIKFYFADTQRMKSSRLCQLCAREDYLTFVPKADKIVRDFWDGVAVVVADGAGAQLRLGVKHVLTQLLQLRMVTVKEQMSPQLFRTLQRTETTVSPKTVPLRFEQKGNSLH